MLKPIHVSLVIAVATLTVLTTGTILHDANGHSWAAASGLWQRTWKSMADVFASTAPHPVPGMLSTTASDQAQNDTSDGTSHPTSSSGDASTQTSALTSTWSRDDLNHLVDIGTRFASSMSQAEWETLAKDFGLTGSQTQSDVLNADVMGIIRQHLTPSDMSWIQQHFQGPQAFQADDLQLLQGAVTQLEQQLTPDELAMVEQGLNQWLSSAEAH